ncbi:MAG TPA: DUF1501 domain-containing protein [Planctomycetes bacterium]|nr:DUF1501 domain-containing protein [Planctomycetota bacterium]HIN81226.1 DUF1501 domain-containing protein [Planctomycetota bacterium]
MINRRDLLRNGSLAALGLILPPLAGPRFLGRRLFAGTGTTAKKMIFIFQRGGNDAVNTVIPRGDLEYNQANRPSLFINDTVAIDLGNGFAQLHPALEPMMEVYNHILLNGVAGPGNLAVLHRVGYPSQSRSHFSAQQFWENGVPGDDTLQEGMIYRRFASDPDFASEPFPGAFLDDSLAVSLRGAVPIPAFPAAEDYSFDGSLAEVARFLGQLPSTPGGTDGKGLYGVYGGKPDLLGAPYRDILMPTGVKLGESVSTVQQALAQGPYVPENGAVYPNGTFGTQLSEIAMLLKRTPASILGVNIGGWDTHTNQGTLAGNHPNILGQLALGIQALSRDLQSQWQDVVVVTLTEFGRTSAENGSQGTDHGASTAMFVAGGSVIGGVYNCDASTWATGDLFTENDRYVAANCDYRSIFAEIFQQHFGDDPAMMDTFIPGFDAAAAANPELFAPLGFLG